MVAQTVYPTLPMTAPQYPTTLSALLRNIKSTLFSTYRHGERNINQAQHTANSKKQERIPYVRRCKQTRHRLGAAKVTRPVQRHGDGHVQGPDAGGKISRPDQVRNNEPANAPSNGVQVDDS